MKLKSFEKFTVTKIISISIVLWIVLWYIELKRLLHQVSNLGVPKFLNDKENK